MRKYTTFAELEQLLLTAIGLPGSSIKTIAEATDIPRITKVVKSCIVRDFDKLNPLNNILKGN